MNFVFLMDPLETVVFEKDTSFILMLGASPRHSIYHLAPGGISLTPEGLTFDVEQVEQCLLVELVDQGRATRG